MFGSICRSCDALPDGVLMLVTLIYRQIHKTFASSISDGGLSMLNATKLILSKLVMDHLYAPIITDPKKHGIVGEKVLNELKSKKAQSGTNKKKDLEEQNGQTTPPFVSINLEILSDTLRHLASTLKYNSNAKWLNSLDEHVLSNQSESISWAASMIRLGSGMDLSVRRPVELVSFCFLIVSFDLLFVVVAVLVVLLFLSLLCFFAVDCAVAVGG